MLTFRGMQVFKDPNIPLQRTNRETGEIEDAFFWLIDGKVLVHPDRWDLFVMAIEQPDILRHPDVFALLRKPLAER
jgi:hypothetical protein